MNVPTKVIGAPNESYADRPTVKAVIKHGDKFLILNDGLLPGGGIDENETVIDALSRELQEELGFSVKNIESLGTVTQYRDFLHKKYIVHGFVCELDESTLEVNPQDEGEKNFKLQWLSLESAIKVVSDAIAIYQNKENSDDSIQGKLFNLMTTKEFLNALYIKNLSIR